MSLFRQALLDTHDELGHCGFYDHGLRMRELRAELAKVTQENATLTQERDALKEEYDATTEAIDQLGTKLGFDTESWDHDDCPNNSDMVNAIYAHLLEREGK